MNDESITLPRRFLLSISSSLPFGHDVDPATR